MIAMSSLPVLIFGEVFDAYVIRDYETHGLINHNVLDENVMHVLTVIVMIEVLVVMRMVIRNVLVLEVITVHNVKLMVKFWVLLLVLR